MNLTHLQTFLRAGYQLFRLGSSALKEHVEYRETPEGYDGRGCRCLVNKDYKGAVKWFRLSAERGLASSQLNLGNRYVRGQGVTQDYAEAAKWYGLAASQGHPIAQLNLALLFDQGNGVPKDPKKAWELAQTSANAGYSEAQFCVGHTCANGEEGVVERDYVRAYMWLTLAAKQGHAAAEKLKRELTMKMAADQIAAASRSWKQWKPRPNSMPFQEFRGAL